MRYHGYISDFNSRRRGSYFQIELRNLAPTVMSKYKFTRKFAFSPALLGFRTLIVGDIILIYPSRRETKAIRRIASNYDDAKIQLLRNYTIVNVMRRIALFQRNVSLTRSWGGISPSSVKGRKNKTIKR